MPVYKTKNEKTKDNKIWYFKCNYRDTSGNIKQKKSKKFSTKEEATKEEAKFLLNIGENKITNKITLNDIYKEYINKLEKEVRPQTLKKNINYYKHIEPFLGNIPIEKLTLDKLKKWQYEMNQKQLKCSYKNKIYTFIKTLIKYSNMYYGVNTNALELLGPFKDVNEKKEEMLFFTEEEFYKYISVINDLVWKTVFETLFYCGLRQGELQALTWEDIDFDKKTINVNKTLTTKLKGQKYSIFPPKTKSSYRTIPIINKLYNDLKMLYNAYSQLDGFNKNWFVFGGIRPIPESTIQNHKNNYCKLAELKQIRIHDFRHSCASLLISKNADPVLVAKYLGHADVSMTLNRYSHMYKSKLDELIKLIEN